MGDLGDRFIDICLGKQFDIDLGEPGELDDGLAHPPDEIESLWLSTLAWATKPRPEGGMGMVGSFGFRNP